MRYRHFPQKAVLTLLLMLLVPLCACSARRQTPYVLALLTSSDTGHYWENIIDGANTAAERMNVQLKCYAPDEENGIVLGDLARAAVSDGADALLVAYSGEEEMLESLKSVSLPIVAVGTVIESPQPFSTILSDDAKTGHSLGKVMVDTLKAGDTVLLLADSPEYKFSELCEANLRAELEAAGLSITRRIYCGDSREWAYRQALQQLYLYPELDGIVGFTAQSTVGAAQAVQYLNMDTLVVGIDVVPDLIKRIEDGSVTATLVRNSFGMGYLAVEYAKCALNGEQVPQHKTLSSVQVDQNNLFTPEVEKLIFAFQ